MTTAGQQPAPVAPDALSSFLLSVVIVDDHAELTYRPDQAAGGRGHGLDAKAIVDAFADEGMVCGVLRPSEQEANEEKAVVGRVREAARRADIVILDWVLKKDDEEGELAREILRTLLKDDDSQHTLRFFAIYTATPRLREIAGLCEQLLESLNGEYQVEGKGGFTLRRGPISLSVFAKETLPEFVDDTLEVRRCKPEDLPHKILEDIRSKPAGLIESAALRSVAEVRRHTHRLLARFPSDVDAGYLWHRARQKDQDDGPSHVVQMIGAEITDLIDSEIVRREVSSQAAVSWLEARREMISRIGQFEKDKATSFDHVKAVVEIGAEAAKAKSISLKVFKDDGLDLGLPIFEEDVAKMDSSHECFAMLMTLRDNEEEPYLHSGVIVQIESEFFVCIQPLCDSVRLNEEDGETTWFPFLRLLEPGKETKKNRFNIVIPVGSERVRRMIPDKPSYIQTIEFVKDGPTVRGVIQDENMVFKTVHSPTVIYRATLRPMKAVSVVTKLAGESSRTGLDDPEWLIGWAKKN